MSSFLAWVSLMKSVSFQMIFLLYVDQFYVHVSSYLSTCISLLPCRCLSFFPHDIAPISVTYLLCCPTSSFETLSLSPSCPAPPWKWCHSSHEKGDNGHNGRPPPPRGAWEPNYVGKSVKQAVQGFILMLAKSGFLPPREKGDMETHSCLLAGVSSLS